MGESAATKSALLSGAVPVLDKMDDTAVVDRASDANTRIILLRKTMILLGDALGDHNGCGERSCSN